MPPDISPILANELERQRLEAFRLFAAAPLPEQRAAIKQILRELDFLPAIGSESFLLQGAAHALSTKSDSPRVPSGSGWHGAA